MILAKKITFWVMMLLFAACSKPIEIMEKYDDSGNLTIAYERRKSDFAKHGWYKSYYPDGQLQEEKQYKDNELHGIRKIFSPSGQMEILETYVAGDFEGLYQSFYADGTLKNEGMYTNNAMNGTWKFYHSSGNLKEVVTFENNDENGPFQEYHESGKLKTEGIYKGGSFEVGELLKYDSLGQLTAKLNCEIKAITDEQFSVCTTVWEKE